MMTTTNTGEATAPDLLTFLADNLAEFRPFAYYDKHLDCIRVQILDCSVTEERANKIFTVLRPNYCNQQEQYVGFTIKGVRHLFNELGMEPSGVMRMADILDAIVKTFPESTVRMVTENFEGDAAVNDLEVDFAEAA